MIALSAAVLILISCGADDSGARAAPEESVETAEPETTPPTQEDADGDGWSTIIGDCDDADPDVHPNAEEVCDGADNDCDGATDEGVSIIIYADSDGDGFGDEGTAAEGCEAGAGQSTIAGDCDDTDSDIHPDAVEQDDNTRDEDCDGLLGETGGVAVTFADCDGAESRFVQATDSDSRLRIISILDPATDGGSIDVRVDVNEPTTLVLSGDGERQWVITEVNPDTIERVLVSNEASVTVDGLSSVIVDIFSEAIDDSSLSEPVDSWDDPDARSLLFEVENRRLQSLDSFHSCHRTSAVTITSGTPLAVTEGYPECGEESESFESLAAPDRGVVAAVSGCASVVSESALCLSTTAAGVVATGLDSGAACTVIDSDVDLTAQSITWGGDDLYLCSSEHRILTRLDLGDGTLEKAYIYCDGVTEWGGELLLFPHSDDPFFDAWRGYTFYSFETAQCVGPTQILPDAPVETRFTTSGDVLSALWGTGETLQRYDLPDIDLIDTVTLEGVEGLLYGLSALGGDRVVINTSAGGFLRIHSATTGELLDAVPVAEVSSGLVCVEN